MKQKVRWRAFAESDIDVDGMSLIGSNALAILRYREASFVVCCNDLDNRRARQEDIPGFGVCDEFVDVRPAVAGQREIDDLRSMS